MEDAAAQQWWLGLTGLSDMARAGVCGGGGGLAVRWGGAWRGGGRRGRLKSPLRVEGVAGGGGRLHAGGANLHVDLRNPYVDRRYLYVGPCTVLVDGANLSVDRPNLYVGSSTKGLGRCTV